MEDTTMNPATPADDAVVAAPVEETTEATPEATEEATA
jgi:hypothetical protein